MKQLFTILIIFTSTFQLFAQNNDNEPFEVYNEREEDGTTVIYAKNNYLCDESVIIDFKVLKNMKADVKLPFKTVVPANTKKVKLFSLKIINQSKESGLSYLSQNCHGNVFYGKPDEFDYLLPYEAGKTFSLDQGYGGSFSHFMKGKKYGLDFNMPAGSKICAAREGIVIRVKDDSDRHGKTSKYQSYGNYITIYHKDGTFSDYYHIKKNGSKIKVGDKVTAGQVIALSGNTGWTSGPHLHFEVYKYNENFEVETIKTLFLQAEGKSIYLKEKEKYTSVH